MQGTLRHDGVAIRHMARIGSLDPGTDGVILALMLRGDAASGEKTVDSVALMQACTLTEGRRYLHGVILASTTHGKRHQPPRAIGYYGGLLRP